MISYALFDKILLKKTQKATFHLPIHSEDWKKPKQEFLVQAQLS